MTMRSPVPLARCSSHDQIRPHQTTHEPPSPTPPPRSNSFVLSRRCGVVSEQDVLRLAAATFDGGRLAGDAARPPPRTPLTTAQTASSPRPAAVLRQRSADCRPRPQSIGGYLEPLFAAETPVTPRVNGHGPLTVDPQLRLQNVPLLPNRQPIQQPGYYYYVTIIKLLITVTVSQQKKTVAEKLSQSVDSTQTYYKHTNSIKTD